MNLALATPRHGAEEDTVTPGLMGAVQPEFLRQTQEHAIRRCVKTA